MEQKEEMNKSAKQKKKQKVGAPRKDYTRYIGQTFGELTILKIVDSKENSKLVRRCECRCSCGKITMPQVSVVINGYIKSCGHTRRMDYNQLIGQTFGELTILKIVDSREDSRIVRRCECRCSCGKITNPRVTTVTNGFIKSCGHARKKDYSHLIGQTFNELTVLKVMNSKENSRTVQRCECRCSCGKITKPRVTDVIRGYIKSCGHAREKDYSYLIGQTFGELTILKIIKTEENSKIIRKCECRCSCGKITKPRLTAVINSRVRSCGHVRKRDYAELIGQTFGELTILKIVDSEENSKIIRRCECRCSCGKITKPRVTDVVNGSTRSCGHLVGRTKRDYTKLIGQTFNKLTILKVMNSKENSRTVQRCECRCSCGKITKPRVTDVIRGYIKSCGHAREKDYSYLIGQTFGELTILKIIKTEENSKLVRRCECRCSCGKITKPRIVAVMNGCIKSCGHLKKKDYTQYIGQTFGDLTILDVTYSSSKANHRPIREFECSCSCGEKVNKNLYSVLNGKTKSCGHLLGKSGSGGRKRKDYTQYIGQTFNELTILNVKKEEGKSSIIWKFECLCSCGEKVVKRANQVLSGRARSCGHLKKKDYSNLIGQKFGELTILEISEPIKELNSRRISTCLCSCGRKVKSNFSAVINGQTKTCGDCSRGVRSTRDKDCSYLIGKTIGELTILFRANVPEAEKHKEYYSCRCSCGNELVLPIEKITSGKIATCLECKNKVGKEDSSSLPSKNNLGIRNIHWDDKEERFVVAVKRAGKWFKARAKTLEEAIEKRDQKLKEAEGFAKTSKFLKKVK